jgi:hypothetical protein
VKFGLVGDPLLVVKVGGRGPIGPIRFVFVYEGSTVVKKSEGSILEGGDLWLSGFRPFWFLP